ncbi:MAG: DUF2207 domain-containing protein, partial [Dehalococcoidia bacterium]
MKALRLAAVALIVAGAVSVGAGPAGAGSREGRRNYQGEIEIEPSGDLLITETIDYDFGDFAFDRHGIFRDIPIRFDYEPRKNTDRVYELEVVSVEGSEGTPDEYTTSEFKNGSRGFFQIKIGDADTTIEGEHTYEIVYRVKGALNGFEDHDELYWNAIGDQWRVIVDRAVATV